MGKYFVLILLLYVDNVKLAIEKNKPLMNPLYDRFIHARIHEKPIPSDKIKKIKKFWNKLVKTEKAFVQEQLKEYGYDPKKLSWPRKKKIKPIPKGWKLNWEDGGYSLASFYVKFNIYQRIKQIISSQI